MMELSISRPLARSIMEDLASHCCPGKGYTAIRLGRSSNRKGYTFSLGDKGTVFSIVPTPPPNGANNHEATTNNEYLPSVIAAHEKSTADQRELASTEEGLMELLHSFDMSSCEGGRGIIRPALELLENSCIRRIARSRMGAPAPSLLANGNTHGASHGVKTGVGNAAKRGKETTTAAAFFAQKGTKKKPIEKKSGGMGATVGKENNTQKPPSPPPPPVETVGKPAPEDAQTTNAAKSANVDDFQGDTDEDDDFLRQDQERKARVAREARKEIRANVVDANAKKRNTGSLKERRTSNPEKRKGREEMEKDIEKSDDKEEEGMDVDRKDDANADVKKGGMDVFAKKNAAAFNADGSGGGSKKRRKKLVEKTIMENGYLKTETVTVWEDVEEEEEEVRPPTSSSKTTKAAAPAKSKSAPAKGKKQGNLMGFFQKK
eukprot:CCRYP_001060-RA/>CCRYP_001060-RA protein AED:0.15 eAED:0.15 QI:0/-1/0/1/-1/1/1/0/432